MEAGEYRAIVKKENWSRCISQGAKLTMSMVMSHLQTQSGQCPRPRCTGVGMARGKASSQLTWYVKVPCLRILGTLICRSGTCCLEFFPAMNDLGDVFSRVFISEEDVARQQVEEDLRLYGSRPKPLDAIDLPPKRNVSDNEAAFDRPAKLRNGRGNDF